MLLPADPACADLLYVNRGRVLLFPAEDSLAVVRQRLEGISTAAGLCLSEIPIDVITSPSVRLDREQDTTLLTNTVAKLRPSLLILDPLIRLHRADENDATQMAALLSYLRQLQRKYAVAIVVVHHARKGGSSRPGQGLRGSSELHGWGDSNLYLRRYKDKLTLCTEHRAAASRDDMNLYLKEEGKALSLALTTDTPATPGKPETGKPTPAQRIIEVLQQAPQPVTLQQIRKHCAMRNATVCAALNELCDQSLVVKQSGRYHLNSRVPGSAPIEKEGTGIGNCVVEQSLPGF